MFTADQVRDLALAAGVQVNVLMTGPDSAALASLARDTGGQSFSADASAPHTWPRSETTRLRPIQRCRRRAAQVDRIPRRATGDRAAGGPGAGRVAGGAAAMTSQPVLPLSLLFGIAAAILVPRVMALRRLTGAGRTRVAVWRWSALTSAMLLLIMAAARPVIEPHAQSTTHAAGRQAPNVFLVVDRSPDMRVEDLPGGKSRMAGARDDMAALIDRYPGARFAVISFATNRRWTGRCRRTPGVCGR